jgi:hypothetical protein
VKCDRCGAEGPARYGRCGTVRKVRYGGCGAEGAVRCGGAVPKVRRVPWCAARCDVYERCRCDGCTREPNAPEHRARVPALPASEHPRTLAHASAVPVSSVPVTPTAPKHPPAPRLPGSLTIPPTRRIIWVCRRRDGRCNGAGFASESAWLARPPSRSRRRRPRLIRTPNNA